MDSPSTSLGFAITDTVSATSDPGIEINHREGTQIAEDDIMMSALVHRSAPTDADLEFRNAMERDFCKLVIEQVEIENNVADEEEGEEYENEIEENVGLKSGDVTKLAGDDPSGDRKSINYPMRPDADDCSFYMKFGSCKFGSNCKFNHPPRRKNGGVKGSVYDKEESTERAGQTECKYYLTSGGCRYGKDCKYSHSADKIFAPYTPEFNFLGLPIRPGEKQCPYYMRTGSCKYGSNCRFNHPQPTTVVGKDSPSGYVNNGCLPSPLVSSSSSSFSPLWSSSSVLNGPPPYVPLMLSPTPDGHSSNLQWNGHRAGTYPRTDGSLHLTPAFALNNLPTEIHLPMQHQNGMSVEEYPERPGELECNYFLRNGDCKFKSSCKFHHPKGKVAKKTETPFSLNEKGLPNRPEQPVCIHYQHYGLCKYGPTCRYNHPSQFSTLTRCRKL